MLFNTYNNCLNYYLKNILGNHVVIKYLVFDKKFFAEITLMRLLLEKNIFKALQHKGIGQ